MVRTTILTRMRKDGRRRIEVNGPQFLTGCGPTKRGENLTTLNNFGKSLAAKSTSTEKDLPAELNVTGRSSKSHAKELVVRRSHINNPEESQVRFRTTRRPLFS